MTSEDFHRRLQILIDSVTAGENLNEVKGVERSGAITYDEYTERYVALLEQFEREDEF